MLTRKLWTTLNRLNHSTFRIVYDFTYLIRKSILAWHVYYCGQLSIGYLFSLGVEFMIKECIGREFLLRFILGAELSISESIRGILVNT
jgi:hypothetical protein